MFSQGIFDSLWKEEKEIRLSSLSPSLTSPTAVAIHSLRNYFLVGDRDHHRVLLFNLKTRDLIHSFQPSLSFTLPPSNPFTPPPYPSSNPSFTSFPSSNPFSSTSSPISNPYFQSISGISIDIEENIIAVSDIGSHSITIFHPPILPKILSSVFG